MRRFYVWLLVALVVIGSVVAAVSVYLLTLPCTPPQEEHSSGIRYCPLPALPTSTTFIANGTVFTINAGLYDYFQFQPSPASFAMLTGSFTTTRGAAVYIMTPAEFANFSLSGASFQCSSTGDSCFTTGEVSLGSVNISFLPVYLSQSTGVTVQPWFLVMQNPNTTADTNVSWVTNLVATYVYVTASTVTSVLGVPWKIIPYS